MASEAAASQPMKPEPTRCAFAGVLGPVAQHAGVARLRSSSAFSSRRDGQTRRLGARREHAGVEAQRLAAQDRLSAADGRDAVGADLHAVARVPLVGLDRQVGLVQLAAQEVLATAAGAL